jgi:flagellar biosynthetic protein FliR
VIEAAQQILAQIQAALSLGFVVFLRVGAAAALMPAFGERVVPIRVRLVLALGFTVILAPAVAPFVPDLGADAPWSRILLSETVIGLSLGAILRLFILILMMAGSMAAQATSLAQIFGGQAADPMPAIGHILVIGGLALAAMLGLHVKLVMLFLLTYEVLPPGLPPRAEDLLPWGVEHVARGFGLAFALAAPFLVASLIYNLALGVINRAMPQLMVAFVGAPAITAAGLMILAIAAPMILSVWSNAFDGFLTAPFSATP